MRNWLQKIFSPRDAKSRHGKSVDSLQKSDTIFVPDDAGAEEVERRIEEVDESRPAAGLSWMQRNELNVKYSAWLFDQKGEESIFATPAETEVLAALDEILKSSQSGASLIRRMPGVVPQLLQSLRSENFSGAQLAKTISNDIVLVGEVVRLANSSFYNPAHPITSIESAILVLGHTGLRQLITGVAFKPIIDVKSGRFTRLLAERIWAQSEKAAMACRMLARTENADPFEAFLAGLIQYVGLIASLRLMDRIPETETEVGTTGFCTSLIKRARTLSCNIAREWNFPESVARAIEDQGISGRNAVMSPLGKVLAKGDYIGKLSFLLEEGLVAPDDAAVQGLLESEFDCLERLGEVKEAG